MLRFLTTLQPLGHAHKWWALFAQASLFNSNGSSVGRFLQVSTNSSSLVTDRHLMTLEIEATVSGAKYNLLN
jgi:hypothetical protein